MSFLFGEDHQLIRQSARGWLDDWFAQGQKLAQFETSRGAAQAEDWQQFAIEQGFAAVCVPEAMGGAGLGRLGAVAVSEETGRVLFNTPFATSACLCVEILSAVQTPQAHDLLSDIAQGHVVTLLDARNLDAREAAPSKPILSGHLARVCDTEIAQTILVAARQGDQIFLYRADKNHPALSYQAENRIDISRNYSTVRLDGLALSELTLVGAVQAQSFEQSWWMGQAAVSAELIGGGQQCLDMTLSYAEQREQFGRKIGSFQAYKHKCADLFIALETARSACYMAAAETEPQAAYEAALISVAEARTAFYKISAEAIQLHGGIGFTWDYPLHYYFKRARAELHKGGSVEDIYRTLGDVMGADQ